MPTMKQTVVEIVRQDPSRGMGASDVATLQAMFPASPIHNGDLTDANVKADAQTRLIDGVVEAPAGTHYGVPGFNRDYADAPNLGDVAPDAAEGIGSPHTPNPTSPDTPGGQNGPIPADWPPAPGNEYGDGGSYGSGGDVSPHNASQVVARQTIGDLTLGKSSS